MLIKRGAGFLYYPKRSITPVSSLSVEIKHDKFENKKQSPILRRLLLYKIYSGNESGIVKGIA
jgi:hypothetical protein